MSPIFDTLKLARRLEPSFTREQAESLTEALRDSTYETVVTKGDLAMSVADLRTSIADLKSEMVRWIVGAIAFNLVATTGLILTLVKVLAK